MPDRSTEDATPTALHPAAPAPTIENAGAGASGGLTLDLSRLSPAQREAARAPDGPLLVLAGPGSGKTTLLAARVAHLLVERDVEPASVLALTFTTAAARTLRDRLLGVVGPAGAGVDVCTFHRFGLRVVRQWSEELGFGPGPVAVYDADEARALLREVVAAVGGPVARPFRELARAVEAARLRGEERAADDDLRPILDAYEALLRRRRAVDYPAMLALPLRLFRERPAVLRLFQDAYRYVIADEGQDTCAAQYALLRLLAARHRNLTLVADPVQTLYDWRGADPRLVLGFTRDFLGARVVQLDQNYRSTGAIVALSNAVAAPLGYRGPLWTANPPGEPAVLHAAPDPATEAAWVAERLQRLLADGALAHPGEAAVLFRTRRQAWELGIALRERGISYRLRGGGDLFERREVRDALAYLRLAHSPDDAAALARVVNVPPRRLGRLAATLRRRPAPLRELSALARPHGPAAAESAACLARLVADLHARRERAPVAGLLEAALTESGYTGWLAEQPDGAERLEHLRVLRSLAARADADLGSWLAELQLGEEVDPAPDEARLLLTTVHGAKGGEWRVVFLVGMEEGLLPHARALRGPATLGDGAATEPGEEAERRVAAVAVSRPRERLFVSYCQARRAGERLEPRVASRFLRGLPSELLAPAA